MIAKNKCTWLAAILLISASVERLQAQDYYSDAFGDSDLQFFSPVDFDFEDRPMRKSGGFIFNYDKLAWAFTGERHALGAGGTSTASMNPWRQFDSGGTLIPDPANDGEFLLLPGTTIPIPAPALPTAINNSAPRAEFGWGDRYELGYWEGDNGWLVGILDGPEAVSAQSLGFGRVGVDGTTGGIVTPENPNGLLLSPLGSVLIVFDDPLNLMLGFLDVVDGLVVGGSPGGALEADSNGDGILDGDGLADDIDKDGQHGPDGFVSDTAFIPDVDFVTANPDFDDLVQLPTSFQSVDIRNTSEMKGVEIMRTHRLSNRHKMAKRQGNQYELSYGVRYLRLRDQFVVNGSGGVLGRSFWDTQVMNNVVGPQIGLKWMHQRRRMRLDWGGRFLFGYNAANLSQTAALGQDLVPGQLNKPLYFPPTYANHGKLEKEFSPVIEVRLQTSFQVTGAIALKLGYTATFIDNIRRASQQVKYELPNMGFRDGAGTQDIFINGVNFGFDVVY
ncbi:MAG: BBP7 family outer membrane beta-barrel protein [Planctomycetes bacterium]|nr:BBP7 family outer membrane beta-barrel protein [Planctomycetota bacterium]